METKKNQSASIEKLRMPMALTGLLFTGSIVLASFTYTSGTEGDQLNDYTASETNIILVPEVVNNTPPPPAPPTVQVALPPNENIIPDTNSTVIRHLIPVPPPPKPPIGTPPPPVEPPIIDFPDVEARFNGNLKQWIAENVQYPQTSIELNEQGIVYLSFVVKDDGSVSNIIVERGVSQDIDREAKRLLRAMPHWIPGEAKGKKVNTRCHMPINFTLH
jgi:TonB family protein